MADRVQGSDLILDTGNDEVAKLVTGAIVTITFADGVTLAPVFAGPSGDAQVGQPLTTRHGIIVSGSGGPWYLDPGIYVRHAQHPDGRQLQPLRILVPDLSVLSSNQLSSEEAKTYAMNLTPLSRAVDPSFPGMFGDLASGISTYGAPASAKIRWPDGSYGKFKATTIAGGGGANPSTVEAYEVTYRAHIDTSRTDRKVWIPFNHTGFSPLSDSEAASLITRTPETWTQNVDPNNYVPTDAELTAFYAAMVSGGSTNRYRRAVTGRPGINNPTTDELIQWCSHKWGIPTDLIRAEMHLESKWSMLMLGDLTGQPDSAAYLAQPAYARVAPQAAYESLGISQLRWRTWENPHPGVEPLRWESTAFNLDYYGATVRSYLDDPDGWRSGWSVSGDTYAPGDYWKAVGSWFLPLPWSGNAAMDNYIAGVQSRMTDKPWLVADFTNIGDLVKIYRQPPITRNQYGFVMTRPDVVEEAWTPPSVPTAAPANVVATPGNGTITVTWDIVDEAHNGGTPVQGYILQETDEGWSVGHGYNSGSFTFSGLTNGTPHRFTVRAFNDVGNGPVSASSNSATPAPPAPPTAPAAPTNVHGAARNGSVSLAWDAPATGGSPITAYRITPYVGTTAQSPVTSSASSPNAQISGLTNGQAYTFKVAAINAVGTGPDSASSAALTPSLPALPLPVNMPIVSRGVPATSNQPSGQPSNIGPGAAVDAIRSTQWNSINDPSSGSPARLTLDLRGVPDAALSAVWAVLHNQGAPGTVTPGSDPGSWYGMPKAFKLRAHASTGAQPADADGGWVDIATITGSSSTCSVLTGPSDAGYDLSTYNWVQIVVTSEYVVGQGVFFNFDLRDVRNGHADTFMFYGDSWIFEGVRNIRPDNPAWRDNAIEGLIEAAAPTRNWPIIQPAGTGGWTAIDGDNNKVGYIGQSKCRFVVLALGANDANAAATDLNGLGGVSSAYAQAYKTRMQSIIDYAVGLGKFVIIPYVNYQTLVSFSDANSMVLNQIIEQLLTDNPLTTIKGADIYGFFKEHPQLLRVGGTGDVNLHPSFDPADTAHQYLGKTGYEWYHQIWADWIVQNLYTAPGSTSPGVPRNLTAVASDGSVALDWDAPLSDGGAAISGYRVLPYIGGVAQAPILTGSSVTAYTVTGLTNGTAYTFVVQAVNAVGIGPGVGPSAAVTPSASAPSTLTWADDFEDGDMAGWNGAEEFAATFTALNTAGAGRSGGRALVLATNATGHGLRRRADASRTETDTLTTFWFRPHVVSGGTTILLCRGDDGGYICEVDYDAANHRLVAYAYADGNVLASTLEMPAGSSPLDTWVQVSLRMKAEASGRLDFDVTGQSRLTYTGDLHRAVPMRQWQFWLDATSSEVAFDDIAVYH